jgi:hypothetical protein
MVDDNDIECVFCGFETDKSRINKVELFEGALPLACCPNCYKKLKTKLSGSQTMANYKRADIKKEKAAEVCFFLGKSKAVDWSLQKQADLLNKHGITTNRGKQFTKTAVSRCFETETARYEDFFKAEGQTYRENLKADWPDDDSL